ncbi:MAG: hypothetical protein R6U28_11430 [Cyclonatronaceae bacterium]
MVSSSPPGEPDITGFRVDDQPLYIPVTSIRPSGRKAMDHGCFSSPAIIVTRRSVYRLLVVQLSGRSIPYAILPEVVSGTIAMPVTVIAVRRIKIRAGVMNALSGFPGVWFVLCLQ